MPLDQLYVPDRAAWRKWLAANHAKSKGVWLIYDRKSSREDRLAYADAVEEALCFGWIDSTLRPLSATQYMQLYTPRKPKSSWSKVNKERVTRLVKAKLMRPPGAAAIALAKKNGSWTKIDAVEALTMPDDLGKALAANPAALANFNAFPPSTRKAFLHRVHNCKRPETRAKRIAAVVDYAVKNPKRSNARAGSAKKS